ncbi:hypothetical protein STW0522RAO56_31140 [Raoultella planticola]|nr:hypothetical protein STW0522RAO56_31140 [Raoultella planticola]
MRTNQEITNALTERLKSAMRNSTHTAAADRSVEVFQGDMYRDKRGRMVTVLRCSSQRVVFCREGYFSECEIGRREFEMKFKKVQDES